MIRVYNPVGKIKRRTVKRQSFPTILNFTRTSRGKKGFDLHKEIEKLFSADPLWATPTDLFASLQLGRDVRGFPNIFNKPGQKMGMYTLVSVEEGNNGPSFVILSAKVQWAVFPTMHFLDFKILWTFKEGSQSEKSQLLDHHTNALNSRMPEGLPGSF